MKFVKMHGCGNDYIFVEEREIGNSNRGDLSRRISDRKSGVGSDGLIILCSSEIAEFRMEMYNSDGSRGKMCGNGIRCLCKYAFERKITVKTRFEVETDSGLKQVKLELDDEGKTVTGVRVNMGKPETGSKKIKGFDGVLTCVSVGNPHAVVFVENVDIVKVAEMGRLLEFNMEFPDRVNVEFVQIIDKGHLRMRVWERGSGETLSCGTGACASLVAGYINGLCNNTAQVCMPGGTLQVSYNVGEKMVYLYGDANEVFSGEYICQNKEMAGD